MLRKVLVLCAAIGSLALAACDPPGGVVSTTTPTGTSSPTTDAIISQIQSGAQKVCSFVPTVETVTGILATFVSGGSAVNSIASSIINSICTAVSPKASAKRRALASGAAVPVVRGVKVQGYFTR